MWVTGRKGGYDTPVGYYQVQTHSPNAWLTGPDYRVFVKYWVGFYQAYGIHDASWRTIFGGDKYIYDGSPRLRQYAGGGHEDHLRQHHHWHTCGGTLT